MTVSFGALLRRFALLIGLVVLAAAGALALPASAHVRSESHSVWEINGRDVDLVMTIPKIESQRLNANGPQVDDATLEKYLADRVYPLTGKDRCAVVPPIVALSAAPEFRRFDFTYKCADDKDISIHSGAFFDLVQSHTNFAQIQNVATGDFVEELLTSDRQTVVVTGGEESKLKSASIFEFIRMGVMHIFTGVDHMSFLVGLVLLSKRTKDLLFVVTGFTIGHSCTLALAVTGILRPHAEYIDALVAFTIAMVGAENIAVATGKPGIVAAGMGGMLILMALGKMLGFGGLPALLTLGAGIFAANYLMISGHLANAARVRLVVTLVFGLIHGFGFAAGLLEMKLPTDKLAELLFGFNIGVEVGQVSVVLTVLGLAALLVKLGLGMPRRLVVDLASAALVGIGLYWFLGRAYI